MDRILTKVKSHCIHARHYWHSGSFVAVWFLTYVNFIWQNNCSFNKNCDVMRGLQLSITHSHPIMMGPIACLRPIYCCCLSLSYPCPGNLGCRGQFVSVGKSVDGEGVTTLFGKGKEELPVWPHPPRKFLPIVSSLLRGNGQLIFDSDRFQLTCKICSKSSNLSTSKI